jgi:5-methylcytosine-specific restriction endonuclease McrA
VIRSAATREHARESGHARYFTGKPCKYGHVAERFTVSGNCADCVADLRASEAYKAKSRLRVRGWMSEQQKNPEFVERERERKRDLARRRRMRPDVRSRELEYKKSPAVREKNRQYQKDNPILTAERAMRRRVRKRAVFIEDVPLAYLMERDGSKCRICGHRLDMGTRFPDPRTPTRDHIIPLSKGGMHERSNLQVACYVCNSSKGDRSRGEQLLLLG